MKKELNISALVMYLLLVFNSIVITVSLMITYFENKDGSGFGAGFTAAIALILSIISIIYTILAIPPIVLKLCAIKNYKKHFVTLCLPFDAIFTLANGALLVALIAEPDIAGLILVSFMLLVSLAALGINVALLASDRD